MFKISNEKTEESLSRAPSASQSYSTSSEAALEKTRWGYLLYGSQIVSVNATIPRFIQFSWDPETKRFPRCWTQTSSLDPHTLRGEHLTGPQPHLRVHLNDHCWTEHELCWSSPQRQIWVTITCVSLHVSKMPTLLQYLSDSPQKCITHAHTSHKSFEEFTSRMGERIKPNDP